MGNSASFSVSKNDRYRSGILFKSVDHPFSTLSKCNSNKIESKKDEYHARVLRDYIIKADTHGGGEHEQTGLEVHAPNTILESCSNERKLPF